MTDHTRASDEESGPNCANNGAWEGGEADAPAQGPSRPNEQRPFAPRSPCSDAYADPAADTAPSPPAPQPESWRDSVVSLIPALRAFAWSLSHNASDADDLVQETLIKAWTHRDKFAPGTNLRAWLFTILRNTYYTAAVRRRREVRDESGKYAATLSTGPTQDWSMAMRSLQTALAQLPDEHREALVLVGAAGLTYEETAEVCGCALGTIKSRVNRARTRLLKIMEADDASDAFAGDIPAAPPPAPE